MALNANISYGCDNSGKGFITINSINVISQGIVTVTISSASANFSPAFPPNSLPYTIAVPSDNYSVECWQDAVQGSVTANGVTNATAVFSINCFDCDLVITGIDIQNANKPLADGIAVINATGTKGLKQYSLDGAFWQSSNVFNGLAVGLYLAYVRYPEFSGCIVSELFNINEAPVFGCTNPDAVNYNPLATSDDGTCQFMPQYFATGGVMPNPIYIEKSYHTTYGFPSVIKTRHFVTLNLYLAGETVPFAQRFERVRNGKIKADISKDLQIGKLAISTGNGLSFKDENSSFEFEIGFVESYDNKTMAETRSASPKRIAVRAALPEAFDTITANVTGLKSNLEEIQQSLFLSAFENPVKFPDEPVFLSILIDETAYFNGSVYNQLFLERSYFDASGNLVYRISEPVYDTGFVRFEINDTILPCVSYMEVCLNTDLRQQEGECIDEPTTPPVITPNTVQIRDGSGNVIATVQAGNAFVIESGFSFGFRIVES